MSSETSSAPAPVITSMFPQTAAECSSSAGPRPCSPSWKPLDRPYPEAESIGYICWREPDGTWHLRVSGRLLAGQVMNITPP